MRRGFTLIEIMLVIGIIGFLAAFIFSRVSMFNLAHRARAEVELEEIAQGAYFLMMGSGSIYAPDVDRALPSGVEEYLGPGEWPLAPWPGSVYDWDHWVVRTNGTVVGWTGGTLLGTGDREIVQISVRFCPLGEPQNCKFPSEPWAANFDYHSAAYYCIEGPCRSHSAKPATHPGYCFNCQ